MFHGADVPNNRADHRWGQDERPPGDTDHAEEAVDGQPGQHDQHWHDQGGPVPGGVWEVGVTGHLSWDRCGHSDIST